MKLNQLRNQLAGFPSAAPTSAAPHRPIPFSAVEKRALPGMFRLLLPLLLLLSLPAVVQAQFIYETNNGTITITGYTGPGGAMAIPDMINGLPVTGIGVGAFSENTTLTSVTIGSGVTSIAYAAFHYCTNLASVAIGAGVTSIGDYAFYFCTSLASVTLPGSVATVGEFAFFNCFSLTGVAIPASVTSIGNSAFSYCTNLTAVTVDADNSTYSSVGGVLFDKSLATLILCPGAKAGDYTIPSSVLSIGWGAFYGCTGLTRVTIPSSVTNIGPWAFSSCGLRSVTIPDSVTSIGDFTFSGCHSLTNVTIGSGVTSIAYAAFYGCTSLADVTIPSGVSSIGDSAFVTCWSLSNVTIPSSVTNIGYYAFADCPSLMAITVDGDNSAYKSVDGVLFDNSLTRLLRFPRAKTGNYAIPSGITRIDGETFAGCTSLTNITIPSTVTIIGFWAFVGCTNLQGIYCQGNAPSVEFQENYKATFYYLPGTTGWRPFLASRPTALWVLPYPLILDNSPSFGVRTNRFGFIISWATNIPVVVEASTSLAAPDWSPVATNTLTSGASYFSDPEWTNYPNRFYRLRSP